MMILVALYMQDDESDEDDQKPLIELVRKRREQKKSKISINFQSQSSSEKVISQLL
jgi:hypothetical protein